MLTWNYEDMIFVSGVNLEVLDQQDAATITHEQHVVSLHALLIFEAGWKDLHDLFQATCHVQIVNGRNATERLVAGSERKV